MDTRGESAERPVSIVWPLTGSVVVSGWVMWFVCRFQLGSTLSLSALFVFPVVCGVITACIHAGAIVTIRGILDEQENVSTWPLICAAWVPVVWIPALVVLGMDASGWVAALLPMMAASSVLLLHRFVFVESSYPPEGDLQSLFVVPPEATLSRTIFPMLLTALAAQLALVALMLRWNWVAGFLLSLACVTPVWRFPRKPPSVLRSRARPVVSSVAALLVTMIALLPFLKAGPGHRALAALLRMTEIKTVKASVQPRPTGPGYSGIILLLPPKPRRTVLPPAPDADQAAAKAKPQVIPFDGAYWYFKEPDDRPRPDAKVVHGDPLTARIQSTNQLALRMEAHQAIVPAAKVSCCSALRVNVVNADTRPGSIAIEVILRDTETKAHSKISLGTIVLPSSRAEPIDALRPPVHETLTFRFPREAHAVQFSEITVRIKAAPARERAAPQVSIESFVLVP
ncbi:MAG TPA: hypothetical protein VFC37_04875 [Terracidiphilus sp.]|nr:hypothetical protein [Terracidiphilus sp.]